MKVVAFNGSKSVKGNTSILINKVFDELKQNGIEVEEVWLAPKEIKPCNGCLKCMETPESMCIINDDINELVKKIIEADGFILGSPCQYGSPTAKMREFIDRIGMVGYTGKYKYKAAAAVCAVRRGGGVTTLQSMEHLFSLTQCIEPKSSYWNYAFGREKGDVLDDAEGMEVMKNLGNNMAYLIKKLAK